METATTKRTRTRLDPLVLDAIAHTQRNSVSRALRLLEDPPAHIPLEHLTLAGNSLISALGRCGRPREALQALQRLAELGAPFDSLTAAAAVSACSRAVSKVGTLPRPWAERGWAIYRGYIAAAEAAAAKGEAEEKEEKEEEEEEAEEEEEEAAAAADDDDEEEEDGEEDESMSRDSSRVDRLASSTAHIRHRPMTPRLR